MNISSYFEHKFSILHHREYSESESAVAINNNISCRYSIVDDFSLSY